MSRVKLFLLTLAVLLPATVFVAVGLVAAPEGPAVPVRIVLERPGGHDERDVARRDDPQRARPGRNPSPATGPTPLAPQPAPRGDDPNDVVVVTPAPTPVRDDGDDPRESDGDDSGGGTDDESEDGDD